MFAYTLPGSLLQRPVRIALIGAGGSGSQMLTGLAQLHHAMLALGHPGGLEVTVIDDDTVSTANIGRQMFYPPDVGQYKSEVLVNRINMAMGCAWEASVKRLLPNTVLSADMIIGCVDTRKARKAILEVGLRCNVRYWLDLGNRQHDGQVILGEFAIPRGSKDGVKLPTVADLYPETCDPSQETADDGPSCSLAEALEKQSLFVNRGVTLYALNILFELFRYGGLDYSGVFVNLKTARTSPLMIDPKAWNDRFGYATGEFAKPKKGRRKKAA